MLEEKDKERKREVKVLREMIEIMKKEQETEDVESNSTFSEKSGKSRNKSRAASSRGSCWGSEISEDELSIRKIGRVRKWLSDKKRMERRNNITLKSIEIYKISRQMKEEGKGNWREWVGKFLKSKIGM